MIRMETRDLVHVTYLVASFSALLYALNIVVEILSRLRSLLYRARLYRADFTHKCYDYFERERRQDYRC